jgi:hypothetical protein
MKWSEVVGNFESDFVKLTMPDATEAMKAAKVESFMNELKRSIGEEWETMDEDAQQDSVFVSRSLSVKKDIQTLPIDAFSAVGKADDNTRTGQKFAQVTIQPSRSMLLDVM